jgi:ATP-dependent DNA helicase RecG
MMSNLPRFRLTLYVGVAEDKVTGKKSWEGFETIEAANGHIQIFEELFPLGDGFQYTFLTLEGDTKCVLQVEVLKSPSVRKASNGIVYLRRSAQKLPQKTEEQLARLRLNKGLFSFEDEAVNIPLHFVENSVSIIEFMLNVIPHGSPEEWLVKQQLIRDNKPSVAATLLFADEPQIAVRYANVKIYYYNTLAGEGTRETLEVGPITIEGNLYNQIYNSVEQTINVVEEIPILAENGLDPTSSV